MDTLSIAVEDSSSSSDVAASCSSSGLVTLSSTSLALAPYQGVMTLTIGGSILGNMSSGSW
jgi:hypothetical protein